MIENHNSFCDQLLVQIVVYSFASYQRAAGFIVAAFVEQF